MIPLEFALLHDRRPATTTFENPKIRFADTSHVQFGEHLLDFMGGKETPESMEQNSLSHIQAVDVALPHLGPYFDPDVLKDVSMTSEQVHDSMAAGGIILSGLTAGNFFAKMAGMGQVDRASVIRNGQLILAATCVDVLEQRQKLTNSFYRTDRCDRGVMYDLFTEKYRSYREISGSLLNEADFALTALSICARRENLFYLNAPPQFERGAKAGYPFNPNIDGMFLTVDRSGQPKEVIGVQLKTRNAARKTKEYDTDETMLVDGETDLQNTKETRIHPHRSERTDIPWPGQIAVHTFLELIDKPSFQESLPTELLSNLRQYLPPAKELVESFDHPSSFTQAISNIERLLAKYIVVPPKTPRIRQSTKKRRK